VTLNDEKCPLEEPADASRGFGITVEQDQKDVRVRIAGELDIATVPRLDHVLNGLAGNGHNRLLLDLDDVDFMDSSGVSAIVRAQRAADSSGHRLTVFYKSPQVQQLFKLTNMQRFADVRINGQGSTTRSSLSSIQLSRL
jgi:anti-sigma B factor antagonist